MAPRRWLDLTWEEVRDLAGAVAILPTGAVEAHGPHLPLGTDVIIAEAMAADGAHKLEGVGVAVVLLPPIAYTAASFAAAFPGTVHTPPEAVRATVVAVATALEAAGAGGLAIANAHLDPIHLGSIRAAIDDLGELDLPVAFPDVTRKPWALRLGDEFRSGACHAGRYEGSIVMAARPELVREEIRRRLAPNPASLSEAIRAGKTSFAAAGGEHAYFGYPAEASAAEGAELIAALGTILAESVQATLRTDGESTSEPEAAARGTEEA